jgi:hypothetical protein
VAPENKTTIREYFLDPIRLLRFCEPKSEPRTLVAASREKCGTCEGGHRTFLVDEDADDKSAHMQACRREPTLNELGRILAMNP